MRKLLVLFFFIVSFSFASVDYELDEVDCLIIKEENSIICKYTSKEVVEEDKFIKVEWINPSGEMSRERKILFPAGHGSVYDFRYLEGRELGVWTFKVIDGENIFKTDFELKAE